MSMYRDPRSGKRLPTNPHGILAQNLTRGDMIASPDGYGKLSFKEVLSDPSIIRSKKNPAENQYGVKMWNPVTKRSETQFYGPNAPVDIINPSTGIGIGRKSLTPTQVLGIGAGIGAAAWLGHNIYKTVKDLKEQEKLSEATKQAEILQQLRNRPKINVPRSTSLPVNIGYSPEVVANVGTINNKMEDLINKRRAEQGLSPISFSANFF